MMYSSFDKSVRISAIRCEDGEFVVFVSDFKLLLVGVNPSVNLTLFVLEVEVEGIAPSIALPYREPSTCSKLSFFSDFAPIF